MTNDQREPFCQVTFNSNCSDGHDIAVIDITTLFRDQAEPTDISLRKSENVFEVQINTINDTRLITEIPLREVKPSLAANIENKSDSSSDTRRSV